MAPGRPKQIVCYAFALGDPQRHVFERGQPAEQRGDLEGSRQAPLDPFRLRQVGHFRAANENLPGAWRERAGHQVDEARLARAVRADQCMARAALEAEIDRIGNLQRAKALAQPARLQHRAPRCLAHRRSRPTRPKIPPRANTTTSTINSPIQKYQYTGATSEKRSCAIMYSGTPMNAP